MKFLSWNVENLFLSNSLELYPQNVNILKSIDKLFAIKNIINELGPDFICLTEVGTYKSLEQFNQEFLNNSYIASIIPGNSDRGIDVGFLIKRGQDYRYEHYTHKNRILNFTYNNSELNNVENKLSRDIAELRVYDKNTDKLKLIILLTHLKSKQDELNIDPQSNLRRHHELKLLYSLQLALSQKFNDIPILITGDFNEDFNSNECPEETKNLFLKFPQKDIFDLLEQPIQDRITYIYFDKSGKTIPLQLDYFLIDSRFKNTIKEAYIYQFKDFDGHPVPYPIGPFDRIKNPSDHYPIVVNLNT